MSNDSPRRDLARLLMPTWRALLAIEARGCTEHQLSHWHYIVLSDVDEHPGSSQNQIAHRIVRSPSRLAQDVEELCVRGLLQRAASAADRRTNCLDLTVEGLALTRRVRQQIHTAEDDLLKRLPLSDQEKLRGLLTSVLDPRDL